MPSRVRVRRPFSNLGDSACIAIINPPRPVVVCQARVLPNKPLKLPAAGFGCASGRA